MGVRFSLFLVLILLLWTGLSLLPGPAEVQLPDAEGAYGLTGYDFEDTVYITAPSWESWPERLYAPEDLVDAEAPVEHQSLDFTSVQYATHRLVSQRSHFITSIKEKSTANWIPWLM